MPTETKSKQAEWIVQITKISTAKKSKPRKHYFEERPQAENFVKEYKGKGSVQLYQLETMGT
ncbi:hypothetical protein RyT2_29910 [Pseudolactococcus yaeyamensis]